MIIWGYSLQALRVMATNLPVCEEEMLQIQHVTKANYVKYGAKLLEITTGFAAERLGELFNYYWVDYYFEIFL